MITERLKHKSLTLVASGVTKNFNAIYIIRNSQPRVCQVFIKFFPGMAVRHISLMLAIVRVFAGLFGVAGHSSHLLGYRSGGSTVVNALSRRGL